MPISERNLFHIQKPVPDPVQEIKSRGGTWKGRKSFPHRKFVFSICLYLSLLSTFLFEAARLPKWSVRRSGNVEIDRRKWAANSDSMFQSYEVLGSFPCSKASLSNHSILAPSDHRNYCSSSKSVPACRISGLYAGSLPYYIESTTNYSL